MSDDAQTPAARDPWATPSEASSRDAAPKVPLAKPDHPAADPVPEPNPWAPPTNDAHPGPGHTVAGQGPGYTVAENGPGGAAVGHGLGEAATGNGPGEANIGYGPDEANAGFGPDGANAGYGAATPARPSVHDQQTVTSLPGIGDTPPPSQPWANPFTPPGAAPPAGGPANPFAPPPAGGTVNPFAPPGSTAQANGSAGSFAPHAHGEPVPPPPIAPDGPGRIPYGYPPQVGYGGPGPQGQGAPGAYYGWPGMAPMPRNGMGTAALVLGIIAVVVFCLWPIAILLGVLAVIFGMVSRGRARRGESTNPGQALAGIICGAVGIVLGLAMIAVLFGNF